MAANWICLDDVAKFMIAAIAREDLAGERIIIGGPEALKPEEVAARLSIAMARKITFEYITPLQFGHRLYDLFGDVSPLDRDEYAAGLDHFYSWINENNGYTFRVDMAPVLQRIPVELTTFADWAMAQDWALRNDGPSGG